MLVVAAGNNNSGKSLCNVSGIYLLWWSKFSANEFDDYSFRCNSSFTNCEKFPISGDEFEKRYISRGLDQLCMFSEVVVRVNLLLNFITNYP